MNGDVRREWFEKDYYAVLGVPKNATHAEIKKAYRKLAQKFHPDANAGDKAAEERFKEISAAYDVVGHEEKRKQYDQVRDMAASGFGAGGFPGGPGAGGFPGAGRVRFEDVGGFGDIGDLLSGLFGGGGGRGRRAPAKGADLETEIRVSFDDAMQGATVPVQMAGLAPCATCGGSGAEPGTKVTACPQCSGTGAVSVNQGPFSISQPCPRCRGTGRSVEKACTTCRGSGSTKTTRRFKVRVPAGVRNGAKIRLAGRGEPGAPGAPPGDLFVEVRVAPHRMFGRKGSDLTLELPITFAEAALGANVKVPTLNGAVTLKVPAGTQSGRTFRIKGRGAPRKSGTGDLLVTVRVEVPQKLSREEKKLLEQLQEVQKESPRTRLGVE